MNPSNIKINYRKTRKNFIAKVGKEIYLRDDISCGLKECLVCA
jgi:hypothetical protein